MKKIYLASPYSHADPSVRSLRATKASKAAATLILQGHIVYSPISHGHAIGLVSTLPGDWAFWQNHCISFLADWANCLYVLALNDWQSSIGVRAEMAIAFRCAMDVILINEDGLRISKICPREVL